MYAGLVVPDVPLEETQILRTEAKKKGIELVSLSTFEFFFYFVYGFTYEYILILVVNHYDLMHFVL
jgi:hypothetical protein